MKVYVRLVVGLLNHENYRNHYQLFSHIVALLSYLATTTMPINSSRYRCHSQLTFGVEYEFFLHANATMPQDLQTSLASRPEDLIPFAETTSAAGFVKRFLDDGLRLSSPVEVSRTIEPPHNATNNERRYQAWIVTTDASLTPLFHGNCIPWIGLEVVSPVLTNTQALWLQAAHVGRTIKESPYVRFNERCGFHVHVGNGNHGFTLDTCQRLYSLLLLGAESILDVLFRDDRRGNQNCNDIRYYTAVLMNPNNEYNLTGEVPTALYDSCFPDSGPEIIEAVRTAVWKIWKAGSIDEFLAATSTEYRRSAINFRNVRAGSTGTIEFRKAEGDLSRELNVEFLASWPQVCIGLVAFALEANQSEFARVMRETRAALLHPKVEALRLFLTTMGFHDQLIRSLVKRARSLATVSMGPLIPV